MTKFRALRIFYASLLISFCALNQAQAYEVWMGTHLATHAMATNLTAWSTVAPQLEGFNVNRAPHDTDPASNNDYRTIFEQLTKANSTGHVMSEVARSEITRNPVNVDTNAFPFIDDRLSIIFGFEDTFNYDLDILMFYDERGTYQGTEYLYEWTDIEVQHMRDWMDANGHADVELMWNVRNNSVRNQYYAAHPLVDLIQIEASTTAFLGNTNNQRTFLWWFWTNPATINKEVILQIPRALSGDPYNQYEGTRRLAKLLGDELGYGDDGVRSDRLVFEPVTYNDNYPYLPETASGGTSYANTLTSICLSLIEQRSLFEGRTRLPTNADADSTTRLFGPMVSAIGDQVLAANTSTGPLSFTIDDDLTAASALTLFPSSSDTNLVPLANIVSGGSAANRTVSVTPAPGQAGGALISVLVSDGTLGTTESFSVTVLPPGTVAGTVYSDGADCSIKENPAIEKLTDATVDVGARGGAPWVERCTVYVFQLPDLGAISNPFSDATFTYNFVGKGGSALRGHDLYGLGRRASSTVLTSDFYSQSSAADPTDATRLQKTIMNDSMPEGLVTTTEGGSANLLTYLNAQYAGGAGAGEYVFLRINSRDVKTGVSYATLTMSEGGVAGPPDTRPRIDYQAAGNTPPIISAITDQTIPVNTNTGPLAFTVGDDATPAGSITLAGDSSNPSLVPVANIVFGGSGSNRTVTVTPVAGQVGDAEISVVANDGLLSTTNTFTLTVESAPPPPPEVIAGWDTWDSPTAPAASVFAANVAASAVTTTEQQNWNAIDERGASNDGDWGTFAGPPTASTITNADFENIELPNATTGGTITFTITNTGSLDILLNAFHFDAYAFRPKAARAYELSVLPGGGITEGVIYTSADDEITDVGGAWDNNAHDDIDHSLTGLADHTLGAGESVEFRLAFSSGVGDGAGGHDLWVDNVALTGSVLPVTAPPVLDYSLSGENVVFSWSEVGFKLQISTNDLLVAIWSDVPGGDSSPVLVTPSAPLTFFRLAPQ